MRTGGTLVRVVPNSSGGWDVREPGSSRALDHASEQDVAILRAQATLLNGGVVQVVDRGGFLVETYTVPGTGDRPWWYVPQSPLFWGMGGLFLLQGIFGVIASPDVGSFRFWFGLAIGTVGILFLILVFASRRRDRLALATELGDQLPEPRH